LWQTVCSTFSRSGWGIVRNALLAKGGASKRLSLHLHKVLTQRNKVSPRTSQVALVFHVENERKNMDQVLRLACGGGKERKKEEAVGIPPLN